MVDPDKTSETPRSGDTPDRGTDREAFVASLEVARSGSSEAVGSLLDNCRNYLLLVANSSLGSGLQAKIGASDLVQETFLEAQRVFNRFTGNDEQELLRWLSRILENKLGNAVKRYTWTAKRDLAREFPLTSRAADGSAPSARTPATLDPPSADLRASEDAARLQSAIASLSNDHRRVIELRITQGLSFEEIALVMNRTPEASRKLFARAVDQLRLVLSPEA